MGSDSIAFRYDETKNQDGTGALAGYIPGVPLRDLTQAEFDELPAWARDAVRAAAFFTPAAVERAARKQLETGPSETK